MDLKEFVSETLTQICEGVKDAQERCESSGALINPMLDVKVCNKETYRHDGKDYPATNVKFNVALTESSSNGGKTGIGVFLGKLSVGHESSKGALSQSVTSVEFTITIVPPYINRNGKHVPLSSLVGM
ncbi:hypothetical protein [Prevotella sp. HUN102]|uniref:hypothetical protein n=1 Tax=Prevotella sp. HUN102 TaxID=1392486 RepID=UPI00048D776E|nr:hypothetical protein [Prevotella sp. HUN102]